MRVLRTERLLLRWFADSDAAAVLELLNDPAWIRYIGDRGIRTLDEARQYIASRFIAHYWYRGHGFWAVERRADGAFLGLCGLFQRDALPDVDVGYGLLRRYWGQGYAREAAAACVRYGAEVLGLRRILAITSPDNDASAHVLRAIGMQEEGTQVLTGEAKPTRFFAWTSCHDLPAGEGSTHPDGAPGPTDQSDAAQIDALMGRFFAAFGNRGDEIAPVAALPHYFLPTAVITRGSPHGIETFDVRGFVAPRAELLLSGRLQDFAERQIEAQTEIFGHIAQRWLRYCKEGVLDGKRTICEGHKSVQFVRTRQGWKIAALSWEDAPAG